MVSDDLSENGYIIKNKEKPCNYKYLMRHPACA